MHQKVKEPQSDPAFRNAYPLKVRLGVRTTILPHPADDLIEEVQPSADANDESNAPADDSIEEVQPSADSNDESNDSDLDDELSDESNEPSVEEFLRQQFPVKHSLHIVTPPPMYMPPAASAHSECTNKATTSAASQASNEASSIQSALNITTTPEEALKTLNSNLGWLKDHKELHAFVSASLVLQLVV